MKFYFPVTVQFVTKFSYSNFSLFVTRMMQAQGTYCHWDSSHMSGPFWGLPMDSGHEGPVMRRFDDF